MVSQMVCCLSWVGMDSELFEGLLGGRRIGEPLYSQMFTIEEGNHCNCKCWPWKRGTTVITNVGHRRGEPL